MNDRQEQKICRSERGPGVEIMQKIADYKKARLSAWASTFVGKKIVHQDRTEREVIGFSVGNNLNGVWFRVLGASSVYRSHKVETPLVIPGVTPLAPKMASLDELINRLTWFRDRNQHLRDSPVYFSSVSNDGYKYTDEISTQVREIAERGFPGQPGYYGTELFMWEEER